MIINIKRSPKILVVFSVTPSKTKTKTVKCLKPRISDIINIVKLTTWPSLTSVQFFTAELFFKMCNRNL